MKTIKELFEAQQDFERRIMRITPIDNPLEFYHSVLGIIEECSETLNEDTRYKAEVFHKPGYKNKYNFDAKKREIADIFIYLMNTCIFSGISADELVKAVEDKMKENVKRFSTHRAIVISAFPGTGKSYMTAMNDNNNILMLDSDSSKFSWIEDDHKRIRNPKFPENYIDHIEANLENVDIIFVSSHQSVRDAMHHRGINFQLVYPDARLKQEYLKRYRERGNDQGFIDAMIENWDEFLEQMEAETCTIKHRLGPGQYIADVINLDEIAHK